MRAEKNAKPCMKLRGVELCPDLTYVGLSGEDTGGQGGMGATVFPHVEWALDCSHPRIYPCHL